MDNKSVISVMIGTAVLVVLAATYMLFSNPETTTGSALKLIYKNYDVKTQDIIDWHGELGYKTIEDVGYARMEDGKGLVIYFGKIKFSITDKELNDENLMKTFRACGFELVNTKKGIGLKFRGEEVGERGLE